MTRTGLLGGSFNPPHRGHVELARQMLRQGLADEVWLMVTPQNPLKRQQNLLDECLRLELTREALRGERDIVASDFELGLERPSYTWRTLQALDAAYPNRRFELVVGSDNWLCFDRWAHGEELAHSRDIIVYPRPDCNVDESALPPNVRLLHGPMMNISSTEIRRRARAGEDFSDLVPERLIPLIRKHYGY